jgi:hypothetical protein
MNRFADEAADGVSRSPVMSPARSNGHAYATRYVTILRSYRLKVIRRMDRTVEPRAAVEMEQGCCGDGVRTGG